MLPKLGPGFCYSQGSGLEQGLSGTVTGSGYLFRHTGSLYYKRKTRNTLDGMCMSQKMLKTPYHAEYTIDNSLL